jgi:hypothetical protein
MMPLRKMKPGCPYQSQLLYSLSTVDSNFYTAKCNKVKVKGTAAPVYALKAYRGGGLDV